MARRGPGRECIEGALRAALENAGSSVQLDRRLIHEELEEILAGAAAEGFSLHRVAGRPEESHLEAAALEELCRPFLEFLPTLRPVRREALAGVLALAPATDLDRFTISVATLDLLTAAGAVSPRLIVVDGVQWLDALSRDVVNFVARRLDGTSIVMVLCSTAQRPASREAPSVEVSLLGRFVVRDGHAVVTPPPGLAAKLLKVVALQGRSVHVEEVVEALWPDAEPGRGRARLRNVMSRLRTGAGPLVVRSGDTLAIAPGVLVDATLFTREVHAVLGDPLERTDAIARARRALARYRGDLLPDSIYEPWAAEERARLRRLRLTLLDRLSELHLANGEVEEALAAVEEAITADPTEELRYVRLGRLLLQLERRSAAAAVVRRAKAVAADLGFHPSPALTEVERAIRAPRSIRPDR